MDEVPNFQPTGQNTTFTCEVVSFLFANTLVFEIEYKNGSRKELSSQQENVRIRLTLPERWGNP